MRGEKDMKREFIIGADISSLQAMEDNGAKYYDFDGKEKSAIEILKLHGVNCMRLRIWNRPETSFKMYTAIPWKCWML